MSCFLQVFYTADLFVIVLELATGGAIATYKVPQFETLEERTRRCRLLFQQLICGIKFCHSQGVVHRDIKHENTLLQVATTPDGGSMTMVKISDFGLSKGEAHSSPKTTVGTLPYMGPVSSVPLFCFSGARGCKSYNEGI